METDTSYNLIITGRSSKCTDDMLEAATIDGAGKTRRFFDIVLPYLKSVIKIVISMAIIANFKQFPLIWTMTGEVLITLLQRLRY